MDNKSKEYEDAIRFFISIQNLELQTRFYSLLLDGRDMVLGVEWLMQSGTYATNLQEKFIEFK